MKYIFFVTIFMSNMLSVNASQMWITPQERSQEEDRLNTLMWDALKADNVKEIQTLFKANIVPEINFVRGAFTPLQYAVSLGRTRMAEVLIAAGADVNVEDALSWTPLMHASARNQRAIVRALLEAQANIDRKNNQGFTALMLAATNGQVDSVRALIDAGANVNIKNKQGQTALRLAQENDFFGPAVEKTIKEALEARAQRIKATEQQVMEHTGLLGDLAHIIAESVHGEGLKKES